MSGRRFIDFDAYWGEQKREPLTIRVFGTPHLLPPSLPAKVVKKITVLQLEHGDDLDLKKEPNLVFELAELLFGKARVADWLEDDEMDIDKIGDLFQLTMKKYGKKDAEDDEGDGDAEGEAKAPMTGSLRSSSSTGA